MKINTKILIKANVNWGAQNTSSNFEVTPEETNFKSNGDPPGRERV
jgi:hypothetical protein